MMFLFTLWRNLKMFKTIIQNKVKLVLGLTACAIAILVSPATNITAYAQSPGDVEVCADYIEWVYKVVDGKLYKALLNQTTGLLESEWIYVCDWPQGIE